MPKFISFLFVFCCCSPLFGQRVGVVLSGGGARGIAHIGFLKALEEHQIAIDYIAGTSMGAIIGALYASGYSPDAMKELVSSDEFQYWPTSEIENKYSYYFKKLEDDPSWINIRLNNIFKLQTSFPTNIINPYSMDFAFMELFAGPGAACSYNFDSLFIPFRSVATDIHNDKSLILKNGDLAQAVRASATYPMYFKAIRINDILLFDGGIYDNFPVEVMKNEFNPDFLLGSVVVKNPEKPIEDDVFSQIENLFVQNTEYQIQDSNALVLYPSVKHHSIFNFQNISSLIDSGYNETIRNMDQIKKMIPSRRDSSDLSDRRAAFKAKIPEMIFHDIHIKGIYRKQQYYVKKLLSEEKEYFRLEDMKKKYFRLIADQQFKYVYPRASFNESNRSFDLNLNIEKDKDYRIIFGGIASSSPVSGAFIGIQRYSMDKIAAVTSLKYYFGRFYNSGQIDSRIDISSSIPLFFQSYLTFNSFNYYKTAREFFPDDKPPYIKRNDLHFDLSMGVPVSNRGKIAGGICLAEMRDNYYQTGSFVSTDTTDLSKLNYFSPYIIYERNTLNRKQYPNNGTFYSIIFQYFEGLEKNTPGSNSPFNKKVTNKQNWFQLNAKVNNYLGKGSIKLGLYGEIMYSNQNHFANYTASILNAPAFCPLPESKTLIIDNFRAYMFAACGLKGIFSFLKNFDLRLESYVFAPYKEVLKDDNYSTKLGKKMDKQYLMGSSAIVYHSPFGPLALSMNYYDGRDKSLSVTFNFGYIIFNHQAKK
jgi:NTE family protein